MAHNNKQKVASSISNTNGEHCIFYGEKPKNKGKCSYFREPWHCVKECPKLKEKGAKEKEASMVIVDAAHVNIDFANMVHDAERAFNVECSYNFCAHDVEILLRVQTTCHIL